MLLTRTLGMRAFDCGDIYTGVEQRLGRFLATAAAPPCVVNTKFVPDEDQLAGLSASCAPPTRPSPARPHVYFQLGSGPVATVRHCWD